MKYLFNSFILLIFITFVFNTQIYAFIEEDSSSAIVKKYTRVNSETIKKFEKVVNVESLFHLHIDDIPTFDEVFQLLESFIFIAEDELETLYTQEELDIITAYLIKMARIGVLLGDEEELEKDIEELLADEDCEEDNSFPTEFDETTTSSNNHFWKKSIYCSNPIKKTIKSTKKIAKNTIKGLRKGTKKAAKFVKKNKAVAIAIIAVVAAGVTTYYLASSNSKTFSSNSLEKNSVKSENNNSTILENIETTFESDSQLSSLNENNKSIVSEVLDDNITSFKRDVQKDNDINFPESNKNLWDMTKKRLRDTSAHLSHKVLDEVSDYTKIVPMFMDEVGGLSKKFIPDELVNDLQETNLFGNYEKSIVENYEEKISIGHQKVDQLFSVNQSDNYTKEAKEYREKDFSIAILPPPSGILKQSLNIKKFVDAGKIIDRGKLTKAGRALAKHGGRENSVFPKPIGNPNQINKQGQEILERILKHPDKKIYRYTFKEYGEIIDIKVPEIGGLRYNTKGEFIGFLEP